MTKILKNPHEISFDYFKSRFDLASMQLSSFGKFQPAVWKDETQAQYGKMYGIRILVGNSWNGRSGTTRTSWEYFHMNEDGVITESPRGMGKEYNGRYRITGLDEAIEAYKDKRINHH